ncbi:DNA mismatch repair protein Msh6-like isoform X1 [Amblyomma americanum]
MPKENTLFAYFTKAPNPKAAPTKTDSGASPAVNGKGKKSASPKGKSITNGASSSKGGAPCLHDLVWAKLEGHPYWPALVTAPPSGGAFVKDRAKQPSVHVRFFDSPPSRAWVKIRLTKPFKGARHPEVPAQLFKAGWTKGVEQAEKALSLDPDDRALLFPTDEDDEEAEDSGGEEEVDDEEEEEEGGDEPSRKKRRIVLLSDSSSSEDEFKPDKHDDSDSDSASSGVDENTVSDPEPESPEKTPQKQSKKRKQRGTMSSTPSSGTKSPAVRKLAAFASPKAKSEAEQAAKATGGAGATGLQTWAHLSYDFLKEGKRRDAAGRLPSHPEFNPRTLSVPESFKAKLTPAMRQWWEMKAEHFDVILFFKLGKFYELYHMDAVIGVEELGLVFMKGEFAHSGFPEIAYSRYSEALIQKGYKVARVEQTETPKMMEERCRKMHRPTKFDRVVRREICRITSKATRTFGVHDGQLCDPEPSYLLAIAHKQESGESGSSISFGVCFVETSVGKFLLGQFNDDHFCSRLRTAVSHYPPVQVLYENDQSLPAGLRQVLEGPLHSVPREALRPWKEFWDAPRTLKQLREGNYFEEGYPEALGHFIDPEDSTHLTPREDGCLALKALGACVWYLSDSLIEEEVLTMRSFERYVPQETHIDRQANGDCKGSPIHLNNMILDGVCLQNLEVLHNASGGTEGTLLATMDFCCTPFGKRLFQQWLCSPPCRVKLIEDRQHAVDDLLTYSEEAKKTRELLQSLPDLERLLSRIHGQGLARKSASHPDQRAILYEDTTYNKRKIGNLLQALEGFRKAVKVAPLWADVLPSLTSHALMGCVSAGSKEEQFPDLTETLEFFENAFDHEQAKKEGRVTPSAGVDADYDEAMRRVKEADKALQEYLGQQSRHFRCKATYVGSGKHRFQIEVPESSARHATSAHELHGQRKGFRRYYTDEVKQLAANLVSAEEAQEAAVKDIMRRIFENFDRRRAQWERAVRCIALLDCLLSLARYSGSLTDASCTPHFLPADSKPCLRVKAGFHPCLLQHLGAATLIPNDVSLGDPESCPPLLALLTGPNMGGKSTLMRQAGLLVIVAQMGARVPAEACELTLVDRIFTRLGASDRITSGESTFFVEVNETSAILRHATEHSLVLLDELGRGTSTHDGMALAHAVVKELAESICCRTLFSTHYHHLVERFREHSAVHLAHMACMVEDENEEDPTKETIVFLYKCAAGPCPKSYGFNAAKLAGIPQQVIRRAFEKSRHLEEQIQMRRAN